VFGHAERKAMAMGLVDRALRAPDRRGTHIAAPGRRVRPLPRRQRRGHRLRPAPEAPALRRLPVGAGPRADPSRPGGRAADAVRAYNFAFLDEQTKRMIRRLSSRRWPSLATRCRSAAARCPCPMGGEREAFR
jgi:hypothetical protein